MSSRSQSFNISMKALEAACECSKVQQFRKTTPTHMHYNGFKYIVNTKRNETTYYRCSTVMTTSCKDTLTARVDGSVQETGEHSCRVECVTAVLDCREEMREILERESVSLVHITPGRLWDRVSRKLSTVHQDRAIVTLQRGEAVNSVNYVRRQANEGDVFSHAREPAGDHRLRDGPTPIRAVQRILQQKRDNPAHHWFWPPRSDPSSPLLSCQPVHRQDIQHHSVAFQADAHRDGVRPNVRPLRAGSIRPRPSERRVDLLARSTMGASSGEDAHDHRECHVRL
jgi:hypothetical protein